VRLGAAAGSNLLTFGLARRGMKKDGSNGVGLTANSWGLADDRSATAVGEMPVVAASASLAGRLSRKLREGDVLLGFVDVAAGWFEVRLNQMEFVHRFTIPPGAKEDYWFGMTLANDHQATIVSAAPATPAPAAAPAPMPQRSTFLVTSSLSIHHRNITWCRVPL
jgi:hypothetical protein